MATNIDPVTGRTAYAEQQRQTKMLARRQASMLTRSPEDIKQQFTRDMALNKEKIVQQPPTPSKPTVAPFVAPSPPPEGVIETPFQSELKQLQALASQTTQTVANWGATLEQQSKSFQAAFKTMQQSMGDQADVMKQQLDALNQQNIKLNKRVDLTNPDLQAEILKAKEGGVKDFTNILQKYLVDLPVQKSELEDKQIGPAAQKETHKVPGTGQVVIRPQDMDDITWEKYKTGLDKRFPGGAEGVDEGVDVPNVRTDAPIRSEYTTDVDISLTPLEQTKKAFDNLDKAKLGDLQNIVMGADWENMTSSQIIQANLQMTLGGIENMDEGMNGILDTQTLRALSAFKDANEGINITVQEIDKIMSGEDVAVTTWEGLSAKIAKEGKDLQMDDVVAEKAWLTEKHNATMGVEREKRGRLEGYLKAKLYAMGAQDSTAGLMVLSSSVNQADIRLNLMESEYTYGMSKLNLAGRQAMMNYTNKATEITLQLKGKEDAAQGNLDDKLIKIDEQKILNEREKQKQTLEAISGFSSSMVDLKKWQTEQDRQALEFEYQMFQDKKEDAYKLSGLTGTIYYADDTGQVIDTGIPTFDAVQWQDSSALQLAQYQQAQEYQTFNMAMNGIDTYGSSFAPFAEQMLNMPQGSLTGLKTLAEQKQTAGSWLQSLTIGANGYNANNAMGAVALQEGIQGSPIGGMFKNGSKQGQCGFFARTKFFDLPPMGDSLQSKIKTMDNVLNGQNMGSSPETQPQVGDMLIFDVGTRYGHVAVVNEVNFEDGTVTLSESNFNLDEKANNNRKISINDSKVVAMHRGDLKPGIQDQLNSYAGMQQMDPTDVGMQYIISQNQTNQASTSNSFVSSPISDYQATFSPQIDSMLKMYNSPGGETIMSGAMKSLPPEEAIMFGMMNMQWQNQNSNWVAEQNLQPLDQKDIDVVETYKNIGTQLDRVMDLYSLVPGGLKGPLEGRAHGVAEMTGLTNRADWSPAVSQFDAARNIVGMEITRLFEKGRISDQDRLFYLSLMPNLNKSDESAGISNDELKRTMALKLESVIGGLKDGGFDTRNFENTSTDMNYNSPIEVMGADGEVYVYDNPNDPEIQQGINAGFFQFY